MDLVSWGKNVRNSVHDLIKSINQAGDYINNTLPDELDEKIDKTATNNLLWEGAFNSGSITVPNLDKYHLFAVKLSSEPSTLLGYSNPNDNYFIAHSLDISTTPNIFALSARMTRNGNNLTYVYAGSINVSGTNVTAKNITAIYGII